MMDFNAFMASLGLNMPDGAEETAFRRLGREVWDAASADFEQNGCRWVSDEWLNALEADLDLFRRNRESVFRGAAMLREMPELCRFIVLLVHMLRADLKAAWDYDLWLRLWRRGGAVRVPGRDPLAFFRWTPDSISGANYERQFAEELAVARADAGRLAPSALLHFLVARGIVFCYRRMAPRPAPDPATENPAP